MALKQIPFNTHIWLNQVSQNSIMMLVLGEKLQDFNITVKHSLYIWENVGLHSLTGMNIEFYLKIVQMCQQFSI